MPGIRRYPISDFRTFPDTTALSRRS
jgi:hypothetical protein